MEGRVEGVVREVEVEGLLGGDRFVKHLFGSQGEGFGEVGIASVEAGEMGDAVGVLFVVFSFDFVAVVFLAVVATGLADAVAANIHVEAEVARVLAFVIVGAEVGLSDMDVVVAGLGQELGQSEARLGETDPVPVLRSKLRAVVGLGPDPIGGLVSGRVLPGHDRDAGGRTNGLSIKLAEAGTLCGKALHVWGAVEVVERVFYRSAIFVGEKGKRAVHRPHVIDKEEDDVGLLCGEYRGR